MHQKKLYILISFLLVAITLPQADACAQNRRGKTIGFIIQDNGDTLFADKIAPLYVFNRPDNWRKSRQWREYYKTVYNFKKTYPYALIAKEITRDADSTLAHSNFTKKEREKYLRQYEKRLFKEFEKPLRSLTLSQGKLLLKLLDRELGQTSFYVIKNYRGGAAAGFWQGVAKLFGSDLKKPYDKFGEDKVVEELVQMYHDGVFDYLYYSMFFK
ncbi:MAG: DUF4294 domain-containing protein [Bacteroidales bacterium]|nr:DUF4294 domain-containing protein [Bacteroidales bacterium]